MIFEKYIHKAPKFNHPKLNQITYTSNSGNTHSMATAGAYQHFIFKARVNLINFKIDYLIFLGKINISESMKLKIMGSDLSSIDMAEDIIEGLLSKEVDEHK